MAAKNGKVKKVYIPYDNMPTYEELEDYVKDGLEVDFVKHIDEIIKDAFVGGKNYEC